MRMSEDAKEDSSQLAMQNRRSSWRSAIMFAVLCGGQRVFRNRFARFHSQDTEDTSGLQQSEIAAERECRHGTDESNSSHVLTILRRAFLIEAMGRRQELAAQRARESHQKLNWWAEDAESPEQKCKAWRRKSCRCVQLPCLD